MGKSSGSPRIFAYGFDKAGFQRASESVDLGASGTIEFVDYQDSRRLDEADGALIPQGIFEEVKAPNGPFDEWEIKSDRQLLLQREKEVSNLVLEGRWACFLVGRVVDEIGNLARGTTSLRETDLCKRFLNMLSVRRSTNTPVPLLSEKASEFRAYVREYGVAHTVFEYAKSKDYRPLVVLSRSVVVGFEAYRKLFFLPFHSASRDSKTAAEIARLVSLAICDYRRKNLGQIPSWVHPFEFAREKKLQSEISSLMQEAQRFDAELQSWREYKGILTASGELLKTRLISVLERFFGLTVDPLDEGCEDFKILKADGTALALCESKGVNGGIKREYINQVDSHRERNGLTAETPGLLLINNEMKIEDVSGRADTAVPTEQITHARNLNCLIVRTVDLLFLMHHLETEPNRKEVIEQLFLSGGGWLQATGDQYGITLEGNRAE